MEGIALTAKFLLLMALAGFVVATMGGVLISGFHHIAKYQIRESGCSSESLPVSGQL